ncbi:MAG: magnesium transporter [Chromatiaceae bacterium]|nr:magnesium transporter [Gammaproteobacteria bacterium]MCP5298151.1 magnesium transporter [Chromatiaceae bacterium]MCP5423309.1 magnesium transporter [Chromatiaceae bacterium]
MLDAVTRGFITLHPAAAARTMARLGGRDIEAIFSAMPRQLAGRVLEQMAPGSASRCLLQLSPAVAGEILARTPMLAAVAALRLMDAKQTQMLLAQLPRPLAARLRLRLRFSETVIGAFVDEDVLTLSPDFRVSDALRHYRHSGHRTGQTLAVLDEHRHLVGVVELADILAASDRRLIQNLMQRPRFVLNARAALQTVRNHPAWLTHDNLPVINRNGVFQGVLRRARVMDEGESLVADVNERHELTTTRTALAEIFWMAVGALFVGGASRGDRNTGEH